VTASPTAMQKAMGLTKQLSVPLMIGSNQALLLSFNMILQIVYLKKELADSQSNNAFCA
jgi:hypothetical protein